MDRISRKPEPACKLALVLHAHQPYVRGTNSFHWSFLHHLHAMNPALRIALAVSPTWLALCERAQGQDGVQPIELLQELKAAGRIELLTCPATSAYLPLLRTEEAVYAQLAVAVKEMKRLFGEAPQGILLPGGAYAESFERPLRQVGISYAIVGPAAGTAVNKPFSPVRLTPGGLALFPCIRTTAYSSNAIAAGSLSAGTPGKLAAFVVDLYRGGAETWSVEALAALVREAPKGGTELITPADYLQNDADSLDRTGAHFATWAADGTASAWLHEDSDMLLRHLHEAELRMITLAESCGPSAHPLTRRALRQAARELLLAQSGDWFEKKNNASELSYNQARFRNHLGCFRELCAQLENGVIDEEWLQLLESKDNLFPKLDAGVYAPRAKPASPLQELAERTNAQPNIVMLAWEYPPKQVGGLASAVCDLAESLAGLGAIVHVVTSAHEGAPALEQAGGVHVHRLPVICSGTTDWIHWAFEMNLAMTEYLVGWKELGGRIDVLHAHDWMVYYAAREIKISFGVPLVATIHATEWGRNRGNLHSALQHRIHSLEWHLTYEAARVFVCSEYMRDEVIRLFSLPRGKVLVFPNGVRTAVDSAPGVSRPEDRELWASAEERILFFIGRLVYEKGVSTLLEAMPLILERVPLAKLLIAGTGPMEQDWKRLAEPLGRKVQFVGFADAQLKDRLYRAADLVVIPSWYEPFGIVALEAMSRGKPLVISDTGGLAEIIDHGVDGYKALPGHPESLAHHVAELLLRPELGRSMAQEAAVKLKKRYALPSIAAKIAAVYAELAGRDIFAREEEEVEDGAGAQEDSRLQQELIPFFPSSSIRYPESIELH